MNRVLEIQDKMRETAALIAQIEKQLTVHHSKSAAASLRSLYKVSHAYEEEFREAASIDLVDVVSYRLFDGNERPTVSLIGKALEDFQTLYSILYARAVSGKPRDRARLGSSIIKDTAFEFSYAYSGSVGFVFTLPNANLLFGESKLDEAMADLFSITQSQDIVTIKAFALKLGLATVRAAYSWVSVLAASNVGAEIEWRKRNEIKAHLLMQAKEVHALKSLIDMTSDLEIEELDYPGTLLGFDIKSRSFRFEPADGTGIIRGLADDAATIPAQVHVPANYFAKIRTTTKVKYATDKPESHYLLLSLVPIPA